MVDIYTCIFTSKTFFILQNFLYYLYFSFISYEAICLTPFHPYGQSGLSNGQRRFKLDYILINSTWLYNPRQSLCSAQRPA